MPIELGQLILGILTGIVTGAYSLYRFGTLQKEGLQKIQDRIDKQTADLQRDLTSNSHRITLLEQKIRHADEIEKIRADHQFLEIKKELQDISSRMYSLEKYLEKEGRFVLRGDRKENPQKS